ncbi:MAG: putative KH and PIN-domain containing protein [Methanonatronarchaeales archaeon]|nr:putative KH and PIN-domain containing protein [Methanonatronarchaeales archaeon]
MKRVTDASVIVDGRITALIDEGEFRGDEIVVPEAVVAELEAQANRGKKTGYNGIEEIRALRNSASRGEIELTFTGARPTGEAVEAAAEGEIDAMIRDLCGELEATLVTSDHVQAEIAEVKGLDTVFLAPEGETRKPLRIREFFDDDVMSVHLRDGTVPLVKRGSPGDMQLERRGDEESTDREIDAIALEVVEQAERDPNGFLEMDKGGATVVQLGDMRIAIARQPFSDGTEITAVRPVADVALDEYRLAEQLKERFSEKRRGVLLAGSPGAGKSTLAQAVAHYLEDSGVIVKTMESPRDLQVRDSITQYTALEGDMAGTADVLLLVRPDYTIYDEVRKTDDFEVFSDMRLAGVGMIGVVHATRGIDALQRLIGRVELGMIPQVADTIVYVEDAEIKDVLELRFTVKVPAGMTEADLARPVIEVIDFETNAVQHEVYTYGEQVVVMPLEEGETTNPAWKLAERQVESFVRKTSRGPVEAQMTSDGSCTLYVEERDVPAILGRGGSKIDQIENQLGLSIDVQTFEEKEKSEDKHDRGERPSSEDGVEVRETGGHVVLGLGSDWAGETVDISVDGEYLFTGTVGKSGEIKISRGTEVASAIVDAVESSQELLIET